jgi:pyruvate dehydrogenase complex dehydrogenase (E1) component
MNANADSHDIDPQETQEWIDALEAVLEADGPERAHQILESLIDKARRSGAYLPYSANTAYVNTIPVHQEPVYPGDSELEHRIRSYIRWNAMAMVVKANRMSSELGGHIATFASAATLYDVGFNHFWHAPSHEHGGDLVFVQGHSAPGMYARSFLEGRLTEDAAGSLPARGRRQGAVVLPASLADARLLAVPHGVHGPRPDHEHLPGPVHEIPAGPGSGQDRRPEGVEFRRRR